MSYLVLTDDELSLLRFTCDLFFVDESPLWFLEEQQREPEDYQTAYDGLVARELINPHEFRITDQTLNRVAPVTECEAVLAHIVDDGVTKETTEYFLLDDIAVPYERLPDGRHSFGPDLDPTELLERLCRGMEPRRSGGALLDVVLPAAELAVLASLLCRLRVGSTRLSEADVRKALSRPLPDALLAHLPLVARNRRGPTWEQAIAVLVGRGLVMSTATGIEVAPAVRDLAAMASLPRHTFVRVDFCDDERALREVTFVQGKGTLFCIGPSTSSGNSFPSGKSSMGVWELDGTRLRVALQQALGRSHPGAPPPQRLATLLQSRGQPIRIG